jgi:carboxylesterase type B
LVECSDLAGYSSIFAKPLRGDASFQTPETLQDAAQIRLFKSRRKICVQSVILSAENTFRARQDEPLTFSNR